MIFQLVKFIPWQEQLNKEGANTVPGDQARKLEFGCTRGQLGRLDQDYASPGQSPVPKADLFFTFLLPNVCFCLSRSHKFD